MLLGHFKLPFEVADSQFDESALPFSGDPIDYSKALSEGKCQALFSRYPKPPIITADTIVYGHGRLYEKPRDQAEAFEFLSELQGTTFSIYTAVTVGRGGSLWSDVEETKMEMNSLTKEQINAFHGAIPYLDKAGGFQVHGMGHLIVKRIEGCFDNVMGFPLNTVCRLLKHVGVDLWHHFS